jgi:hypothetical protein
MPNLLSLTIGVKKDGRIFRVSRIDHRGSSVYCMSGIMGYHISAHDADDQHPFGAIHSRLAHGTFTVFPGNVDIGSTADRTMIPPFAAIGEPVPMLGNAISASRVDERFLFGAKEITTGRQTESVVVDADLLGSRALGWFILLLQAGDWDGAERWFRINFARLPGWRLESVHTWSRAEPWLGVGFLTTDLDDSRGQTNDETR